MYLFITAGPSLLVDVPRDQNITGMIYFEQLHWCWVLIISIIFVAAEVMEALRIPKGVSRVLFRTLNTDR